MPRISVLMAVHNHVEFLPAAVDSILGQTVGDFEFIIIDDGSDDVVMQTLLDYNDSRIKLVRVDKNIGLTRCLNIGLDLAKGKVVARQDADDVSLSNRFEVELSLLRGRTGVVSCWGMAIDEEGDRVVDDWMDRLRSVDVEQRLLQENFVLAPGAMFSMEVYRKIGYFDPVVRYAQDYNYWLRAVREFYIDIVPSVLVLKRKHGGCVWEQKHDRDWMQLARDRAFSYPRIFEVEHGTFEICGPYYSSYRGRSIL